MAAQPLPFPDGPEKYRWFAKFFLDGVVSNLPVPLTMNFLLIFCFLLFHGHALVTLLLVHHSRSLTHSLLVLCVFQMTQLARDRVTSYACSFVVCESSRRGKCIVPCFHLCCVYSAVDSSLCWKPWLTVFFPCALANAGDRETEEVYRAHAVPDSHCPTTMGTVSHLL